MPRKAQQGEGEEAISFCILLLLVELAKTHIKRSWRENAIGNSRITFHHFIFRELFLVIISSWLTSENSGRIISRNLSDLHLLPHLLRLT